MAVNSPITAALFPSLNAAQPGSVVDSAVSTPQVAKTATKATLAAAAVAPVDQAIASTPPAFSAAVPSTMDSSVAANAISEPASIPNIPDQQIFQMGDGRFYNPSLGLSGATREEVMAPQPAKPGAGASGSGGSSVSGGSASGAQTNVQVNDDITESLKALFPESDTLVKQYADLRKSSGVEALEADLEKVNAEAADMSATIQNIEEEVRAQAGGMADESFIQATVADRIRRLMPRINQINARQTALTSNIAAKKDVITEQLGLSKADIQNAQEDRSYVRQGVFDLLETFGSEAFKGASPELLAEIERKAGLPTGTLSGRVQTLKQQEDLRKAKLDEAQAAKDVADAAKLETEIVEAGGRKLLINSQTGAIIKDVGAGKVTGGSGGGSGIQLGADGAVDVSKLSAEAQAIIAGTLNLSDLTPTVKGRIAGELTAAGYKPVKLGVSTQKDLATLDTASTLIEQILAYNADGKLEGIGPVSGSIGAAADAAFGTGSEEAKSVRALIGNVRGTISAARAGLALTATEIKQLDSYTPKLTDATATAVTKLGLLKDFIASKKLNTFLFASPQQLSKEQQAAASGAPAAKAVPEDVAKLRSKYNY